ncbi:hypothetical protein TI39_contig407g00002 [Zymoseptoria brevis]|uniref:ABM domain-containing protein n=1 Tax=Zymoseptoria brevis TaxID=1047168 RepID=A0A0F4GM81_9PEZI|nr:hypothetical protein TI39_contig407g00002 [Zymoseptoria brevis]
MSKEIALLCTLHPSSPEKQERILSLMRAGAREYYTKPSSLCTTWSYFLPFSPRKATAITAPVIAGIEIYTDKSALEAQVKDQEFFQAYQKTVEKEGLYSKEEQLVAWYRTDGFVAREKHARPFGNCLVSLTKFVGNRERVLEVLRDFVTFVRDEEPDVLTYAIFTRPKAEKEVMLFVRYKDMKALRTHSKCPEHDEVVKKIVKCIENDMSTSTTVWQEIEDSFVSTEVGGPSSSAKL